VISSGGDVKIVDQKVDFKSKASSKVASITDHVPGGGDVKIVDQKVDFKNKAASKIGSKDNLSHVPKGGTLIINRKAT
jgi:microtubule-associated protein tau